MSVINSCNHQETLLSFVAFTLRCMWLRWYSCPYVIIKCNQDGVQDRFSSVAKVDGCSGTRAAVRPVNITCDRMDPARPCSSCTESDRTMCIFIKYYNSPFSHLTSDSILLHVSCVVNVAMSCDAAVPPPNRQHLSSDCLNDSIDCYQNWVPQLCTVIGSFCWRLLVQM